MATDAEKLAKLRDARDSGVKRVEYEDYSVTYRSIDEMDRAIRSLEDRVNGSKPSDRRRYASFSKGLD